MTEHYAIVLDVGRTFIRSALLNDRGHILPDSFSIFSSKSSHSKEITLRNIVKIIKFNINSVLHPDFEIKSIAFSLPDDFIQNNVQDFIDEITLSALLQKETSIASKLSEACSFYFKEESYLFGLGEHILRKPNERDKRVLYVLLGSEMSYTILDNGVSATISRDTIDARKHLSGIAITEIGKTLGFEDPNLNPKVIAEMALKDDDRAIKTYQDFGQLLGQYLDNLIRANDPHEIVIGGNIALSYPIFENSLTNELSKKIIPIYPREHTSYYVFFGLAELIQHLNK